MRYMIATFVFIVPGCTGHIMAHWGMEGISSCPLPTVLSATVGFHALQAYHLQAICWSVGSFVPIDAVTWDWVYVVPIVFCDVTMILWYILMMFCWIIIRILIDIKTLSFFAWTEILVNQIMDIHGIPWYPISVDFRLTTRCYQHISHNSLHMLCSLCTTNKSISI